MHPTSAVGSGMAEEARPGRVVEFDRNAYRYDSDGSILRTFAGETPALQGAPMQFRDQN